MDLLLTIALSEAFARLRLCVATETGGADFDAQAEALLALSARARRSEPGTFVAALAQSARDAAFLGRGLLSDKTVFNVKGDAFQTALADRLQQASLFLAEAARPGGYAGALDRARAEIAAAQALHEKALESLFTRSGAVDILKTREVYRALWRLAESLGRCLSPAAEALTRA